MDDMTEMLMKLRPVSFRYKEAFDGQKPIQYGLIAEEVTEVFPDLAVFNPDGSPETVKYHLLPSFLLNAFQRQQQTIAAQAEKAERQERTIATQTEQLAALTQRLAAIEARLSRQAAVQRHD